MYLRRLQVTDFRSWSSAELELDPGVTVLVGSNGQGKTNLLEAIGYVATLNSHRVANDAPLIRQGCDRALVRTAVVNGDRELVIELEITAGKANRARVNRGAVGKARDIVGMLRTVLFAPEDLSLVRGDPGERRRFLDDLLVQRAPRFAGIRADYEKILKQRNALLKSAGKRRTHDDSHALSTLDVWDKQLAASGAELIAGRLDLVADLGPLTASAYAGVAPDSRPVELRYRSSLPTSLPDDYGVPGTTVRADAQVVGDRMLEALADSRRAELERGISLVGPHRDELELLLGDAPAKGYASHGESWSFALSLRLASYELLRTEGIEPVLLLDDVFAELDTRRRNQLAKIALTAEQVFVTAAVAEDVPEMLVGAQFSVLDGEIKSRVVHKGAE